MTLASFVEEYAKDMRTRLKETTWRMKENVIRTKLVPYFGKKKMSEITTRDVMTWQNVMLNYRDENGSLIPPYISKRSTISSPACSTTR